MGEVVRMWYQRRRPKWRRQSRRRQVLTSDTCTCSSCAVVCMRTFVPRCVYECNCASVGVCVYVYVLEHVCTHEPGESERARERESMFVLAHLSYRHPPTHNYDPTHTRTCPASSWYTSSLPLAMCPSVPDACHTRSCCATSAWQAACVGAPASRVDRATSPQAAATAAAGPSWRADSSWRTCAHTLHTHMRAHTKNSEDLCAREFIRATACIHVRIHTRTHTHTQMSEVVEEGKRWAIQKSCCKSTRPSWQKGGGLRTCAHVLTATLEREVRG